MFVSLDIETTGFDAVKDHVIEIAAVRFNEREMLATFSTLVNPGKKIPKNVELLTGITDCDLAGAPTLDEIKEKFLTFIGSDTLIVHNIAFDVTFLQSKNIPLANTGYDSCELARILLPNLPSYSLEILTKILDIQHENKHRALSDAIAAGKLFQLLLKKGSEIPDEKRKEILAVLEKSDWPMKHFFQDIFKNPPIPKSAEIQKKSESSTNPPKKPDQYLLPMIAQTQTMLIEDENYSAKNLLITVKQENIMLAVDTMSPLWEEENIAKIVPPSQYLCLNKLEQYLKKSFFDNSEVSLLLKIMLRKNDLKKGTRQELDIFQEEHGRFMAIEADEMHCASCAEDRCFFARTQKHLDNYAGPILVSHEMLLQNTRLLPKKTVIIDQADMFAENAAYILTNPYKLSMLESMAISEIDEKTACETILSKLGIFFGLCGIFVEKFSDSNTGYQKIVIEESHRSSLEWKNMQSALENIAEMSASSSNAEKLTASIKKLHNTWNDAENSIMWIAKGWDLTIKCAPKNIPETIQKALTYFPSVTYMSQNMTVRHPIPRQRSLFDTTENISEDDFAFIKKMLGLPIETLSKKIPYEQSEKIPLIIAKNLPQPNAPGNFKQTLSYIRKILENTKENIFLLINSRQSIEMFHQELLMLSEILLLSQNQSGGFGKIAHLYRHATKKTLLIGGVQLFEKVLSMPEKIPKILIIHRLPFQPPDDPMTQEIQKMCENTFMEYTIPSAIFKLKRLIGNFAGNPDNQPKEKTIYLLDSRIIKDYGETIQNSMPNFVEISTH